MLVELEKLVTHTVRFSHSDVENWARFSGDWNAIHFDADAANALGVAKPFAHGMLALLPVKQMANDLGRLDAGEGVVIDSRLRMPVFLDETLLVKGERNGSGTAVELRQPDGRVLIACGVRTGAVAGEAPTETRHRTTVSKTDIAEFATNATFETVNHQLADWIALEAIGFRHFLQAVDGERLGESIAAMTGIAPPRPGAVPLVMQTRNTVSIHAALDGPLTADADLWTDFSIQHKDLGKGAFFVQVSVSAGQGADALLTSVESMTLNYRAVGGSHE